MKWLVFFYIYWNRSKNSQNIQNIRDAVAKLAKWNEKRCKKNTTEIIQSITVDFCFIEKSTAIHWIACYSVYDYDRIFVFVFVFFSLSFSHFIMHFTTTPIMLTFVHWICVRFHLRKSLWALISLSFCTYSSFTFNFVSKTNRANDLQLNKKFLQY